MRRREIRIATCIYDLIPLEVPALSYPPLVQAMERYLRSAVEGSDVIFSISDAAAGDVACYLDNQQIRYERDIPSFRLGADSLETSGEIRRDIRSRFDGEARVFLSVGSMTAHKGHLVAVKAFERLWEAGSTDQYVILGPKGFDNPLEDVIRRHAAYGRRLFRIDDANDAEVVWAYAHADCLIQPSVAEGFGLPIIEANRHGLPIIASDIPVFREIGLGSLCYFDVCDSKMLSRRIEAFDKRDHADQRTSSVDWDTSIKALRETLLSALARQTCR